MFTSQGTFNDMPFSPFLADLFGSKEETYKQFASGRSKFAWNFWKVSTFFVT